MLKHTIKMTLTLGMPVAGCLLLSVDRNVSLFSVVSEKLLNLFRFSLFRFSLFIFSEQTMHVSFVAKDRR